MRDYRKVNKKLLDFVNVVSDSQSPEYLHTKEIVDEDREMSIARMRFYYALQNCPEGCLALWQEKLL